MQGCQTGGSSCFFVAHDAEQKCNGIADELNVLTLSGTPLKNITYVRARS